jgi:NAD(P)-dependent dehydrogenase (short-subunit alcohol dehydrogenase family)
MDLELRNKIAVITGGSKGIGLGIAHAFAGEGEFGDHGLTKSEIEKAAVDIKDRYSVGVTAVTSDVATAEGCHAVISS